MDPKAVPQAASRQSIARTQEQTEARYTRLVQLYAFLTHCNQAIVRCKSPQELFDEVCNIAVEHGGMAMAWVGKVNESNLRVDIAAHHGEGNEVIDQIYVTIDESDPRGRGPSGTAIRENQPFWGENFSNNAKLSPWHAIIAPYNWQATATIPLCHGGKAIGAFSMYSK